MSYYFYAFELVLERTQKFRTSNPRTLAYPNFEPDELMSKNQYRTRTLTVELRTLGEFLKRPISDVNLT